MPNPSSQEWARSNYVRYVLSRQAKHWSPAEVASVLRMIEDYVLQAWGPEKYLAAINLLRDAEEMIVSPQPPPEKEHT